MLHAARSHRKAGNRAAALELYRTVRERGGARLARFSSLGEALLSETPEAALSEVVAEADLAGDREVAAVALEERARARRRTGRWSEAVADYQDAALRFEDRRDRLRVVHALADLLVARGDLEAAREALVAAVELGMEGERDHAVQRLRAIARAQGDQLGLRRWKPVRGSTLVSLMPGRPRAGMPSLAPAMRSWRDSLVG